MINNVNTQEIVDFALKNFPADLQLDILQEECAELIKALSKYKRENYPNNMTDFKSDSETRNNVIEEMSHVLISMDVVASIVKISERDMQNEINKKMQKYCPNCGDSGGARMKNIEKHIDLIAEWVSDYMECSDCPCNNECIKHTSNVGEIGCKGFFKRWALEECDGKEN